ncbi:3-deoxy-7-phosphoheptulonate synthase [Clostridium tagluense]|uniref:3-deoxy-7-phosphoheptulonate synthase n=1 Tax=Clostridium tagluense TaxID=360422 RepID=UPI001CF230F5|nr:3-deoxy-7-phosphoheptulonate synthase [Clostridium tagluense]MCB2312720.1 3-deoxy-7-phosphoheptulonate synthase [Clostridium tagluense]MCB2317487.1 3-deoxy-7-phosphoheptulonate synthase [Clostridium tagluense]MCB2322281.1 3-deoxy-7-phosphoheptulonate synthase [Clostridium tagluense]MCB2327286.1 3-deoxy-7-phosphoheptulonate synthase [Clostridium tagluense]MCB2331988.1 3-deoxy-7-phosphoheptulonate synthase [Clostridium tagluense]
MIIVMKENATQNQIQDIKKRSEGLGCAVHVYEEGSHCLLGMVGDTSAINISQTEAEVCVDKIVIVQEPFKRANRLFHPDNSIIKVDDRTIGGKEIAIIAGPCAIESEVQLITIAKDVKLAGANFLRGGAYKPRTSPYSFQGMEEEGLRILLEAKKITGLPIVTEVMSVELVEKVTQYADVLQIGARNMQNFDLLKEVGRCNKTILLKRGMSATIEDLLMSAEYIMSEGNEKVVLCERGIRTFETFTRNTLDLSAIPVLKKLSHLPVIVDPSHASGKWWLVEPLAKAAIAVGADGLEIEVHYDPANAMSDGPQSLKPEKFEALIASIRVIAKTQRKIVR